MEVLLINDGSTDNSLDICYEYVRNSFMFKVISQENSGPAVARNTGIKNANGKYIMYLDSDDTLAPETVKDVTDFFDTVYDEVDLVTYPDQPYQDGKKLKPHPRYLNLKKSGVYDLNDNPYVMQTRISVAVKNNGGATLLFDTSDRYKLSYEDQKYLNTILSSKLKIGFCSTGEYRYEHNNNSLVNKYAYPLYSFENSMDYFETLFSQFPLSVPQYFQALYLHDLAWKLKSNRLFPHHYKGKKYKNAIERIVNLLNRVDDEVIMQQPAMDNYHRHFFLGMKKDKDMSIVICSKENIRIYKNGFLLYKASKFEVIVHKLNIIDDRIGILAFVKSPVFNYIEQPNVFAELTYSDNSVRKVRLEIGTSPESHYKSKEKTNEFPLFFIEENIEDVVRVGITVDVDDVEYPVFYYFMNSAPFSSVTNTHKAIFDKYVVTETDGSFYIQKKNKQEMALERTASHERCQNESDFYVLRKEADKLRTDVIWLYYDCRGVKKDNGYYQFVSDFCKKDGIVRYYINANTECNIHDLFSDAQIPYVVDFGTYKHKILYLAAAKIITAYIEDKNIIPFSKKEIPFICDITHAQIIYLQHGILHAHLPWKYAPGRIAADKIVVSSNFEANNFVNNGFRKKDLIPVGMPRFDHIDRSVRPERKILFAPSWRNYLISEGEGNGWDIDEKRFMESNYFHYFQEFLSSEKLDDFLGKNNVQMDFKIHPIFAPYLKLFNINQKNIRIADNTVNDSEYALYITDFSSFVFDFVYLKRPIIYFVPDMDEFESGMNQYWELDLPFEKAFGNLTTEPEAAIEEVIRIVNNHFSVDKTFRDRMDSFFLPLEKCSERLYEYFIPGKNNSPN